MFWPTKIESIIYGGVKHEHTFAHPHMHAWALPHSHAHACTHTHSHTHTLTHAHAHADIRTYTLHIRTRAHTGERQRRRHRPALPGLAPEVLKPVPRTPEVHSFFLKLRPKLYAPYPYCTFLPEFSDPVPESIPLFLEIIGALIPYVPYP